MGVRGCKLRRKDQIRLLEFFVAKVTARSTEDILGFQATTVALLSPKARQIIIEHLPDIAPG